MPKIYVRVNPRSQISKRHRCAIEFTGVWKELDVDDATRAALEEDPYLEVSETPTVQVEVAASTQAGAIDPYPDQFNPGISETDQDLNNPVKSQAVDGSTGDAAQGSDVTGTASPAAEEEKPTEADPADTLATGDANSTGENAPVVDAAANGGGTAATDGEQQANDQQNDGEKTEIDQRIDAIKAAIAKLDPNNAEHWLKDGRPSAAALESVGSLIVTAAERDSVWASLNKGTE